MAGQPLPDTAAIEEARRNERLAADRFDVRVKAAEGLAYQLILAVHDASDEVVTDYLRPAFDRIVTELRAAVAITAKFADDPVQALNAPTKDRKAFADVPGLIDEYGAITASRRVLTDCGARPTRDVDGEFSSLRNLDELWPRQQRSHRARPWGSGAEGTTWLLRNGGELWLPTPAEQDARYEEVYGEREREARRRQQSVIDMHSGYVPTPRYAQPSDAEAEPQSHPLAQQIARAG